MNDSKKWLKSKGVWGGIFAAGAGIAGFFGFDIPADAVAGLTDHFVALVGAVGGIIAIVGRIVATDRIG